MRNATGFRWTKASVAGFGLEDSTVSGETHENIYLYFFVTVPYPGSIDNPKNLGGKIN
jgi:hypothetical protein